MTAMSDSHGADLATVRQEYVLGGLEEQDLADDPVSMLRRWLGEAMTAEVEEPTAMVLSTVSAEGRPSSRAVLLKGLSSEGLVFYTNYSSRKAEDLAGQPDCALLFPWFALQRQVRVEGRATRLDAERSAAYFARRPRPSQLAAWASPQSRVVASRARLEERYAEVEARFEGREVPLPPFWGGYLVAPETVEFWQGRPGRMHDRLRYRRVRTDPRSEWQVERLAP